MLLYLLAIAICVICFCLAAYLNSKFSDWSVAPFAIGCLLALVVFISTIVFISQGATASIDCANVEAERDVIVYQVEHHDSFLES